MTTNTQTNNYSESAIWTALVNGVADAIAVKGGALAPVDNMPSDGPARAIYIDAFRKTLASKTI